MTVLTLFMLIQMPGPRDIAFYWPGPRAFSVVQKPWGWAHILVQKPRGARGVVTGQIDACITSRIYPEIGRFAEDKFATPN